MILDRDKPAARLETFLTQFSETRNAPIRLVLDLLSEGSYQRVFTWDVLHDWLVRNGMEWRHRVVHGVREPGFLADLGRYYRQVLIEEQAMPLGETAIQSDCLRSITAAKGSLSFARDVHYDAYTGNALRKMLGEQTWKNLMQASRDELIQGELFFQLYDAQSTKEDAERAPRIINFFSALEMELYQACGRQGSQETLGSSVHHLCKGSLRHLFPVPRQRDETCRQLSVLLRLRNRMGHRGTILRKDLVMARDMILMPGGVLAQLARMRPPGSH